jgi:hypothetical protein
MGETITIRTGAATEVIKVIEQGPQGPAGPAGTGLETLTTQGDLLYRGASTGQRLPIGTSGQILKVSSGGIPEWGAESGAVSSVAGRTGAVVLAVADVADAVATSDARLSDARTPSSTLAHAASHLPDGADEIFDQSLNTYDSPAFAGLSVASTGGSGVQLLVVDDDGTFNNISYASSEQKSEARTSFGLGDAAVEDATAFAASGSITTSGLTQSTARILGRTTASTGAVEEITIGSGLSLSAGELSATGGSGVTAVGTTLADILSVSGSDLVADDLAADKLYGWDDSASKAIGFTIGSGLETDTTTLKAKITSDPSGVTGADAITNIMSLTQAEYAAIGSPDAATLYLITDP